LIVLKIWGKSGKIFGKSGKSFPLYSISLKKKKFDSLFSKFISSKKKIFTPFTCQSFFKITFKNSIEFRGLGE
jgi:hypothetical protein